MYAIVLQLKTSEVDGTYCTCNVEVNDAPVHDVDGSHGLIDVEHIAPVT